MYNPPPKRHYNRILRKITHKDMEIKVLRPVNNLLIPVYQQIGAFALAHFTSVVLDDQGMICVSPDWNVFLSVVWAAYAECSRSSLGALISVPIRVRLLEYEAETWVSYDAECGGIRYKSLVRYGRC